MGIPFYGQNGQGNIMDVFANAKVVKFALDVTTSGNDNNSDTGADIPAGYIPIMSVAKNTGAVALASNACVLDAGGVHVTAELNALAAGAEIAFNVGTFSSSTSAVNILVDGSSHLRTGSSSVVLEFVIICIPAAKMSAL
jgi:hypothetical protein